MHYYILVQRETGRLGTLPVKVSASSLLYGRPIGRITRLSVCLSVPYGLVTRKQKRGKIKIGIYKRSPARVSGMQIFSRKGQRSRSPDVKNRKKLPHIWRTCLLTGGGSSAGDSGTDWKLGLSVVRPN